MTSAILVNGVPASGKSRVARQIAGAGGWPLLALDTVKEALFAHLGAGDREHNRRFGRASYQAMFAVAGDWPPGSTAVIDAWFGFQPPEVLAGHIARAGLTRIAEVWCHAPPEVIGERYRSRLSSRSIGHLGADYIPELIALAERAKPLGQWPVLHVDTTKPFQAEAALNWIKTALGG